MLAALGNDVTEIEMQERAFITLLEHKLDLEYAEASGVKTVFGHKVLELTDSAVVAQSVETGEQVTFAADVIIPRSVCAPTAPRWRSCARAVWRNSSTSATAQRPV